VTIEIKCNRLFNCTNPSPSKLSEHHRNHLAIPSNLISCSYWISVTHHWMLLVSGCHCPGLLWLSELVSPSGSSLCERQGKRDRWWLWDTVITYEVHVYMHMLSHWPVQLSCLDVDEVERFTTREQQQISLEHRKTSYFFKLLTNM